MSTFEIEVLKVNQPKVIGYLTTKLKGDKAAAEDVFQKAMIYCWQNFSKYDSSRSNYNTYFKRIANSKLSDYFKHKKTDRLVFGHAGYEDSPDLNVYKVEHDVNYWIERLDVIGYKDKDIADQLSLSIDSVKGRLKRLRAK